MNGMAVVERILHIVLVELGATAHLDAAPVFRRSVH